MYSYGLSHMAEQKQDDQLEHTYSSYVMIRDVAQKTCRRWWTIGRSGERGSGISVQAARHDDDDYVLLSLSHGLLRLLTIPAITKWEPDLYLASLLLLNFGDLANNNT